MFDLSVARHHGAFEDADIVFGAQQIKVFERAPMDIGRVVPMVGHTFGNRHMSAECDLDAVAPVAEIRETDDCLFGEAHQAAQDFFGILHRLDGLAQNNHIKTLIVECGQPFFQIGLDNIYAARHRSNHVVGVDFDAVAAAFFVFRQSRQQFAVAAAQV